MLFAVTWAPAYIYMFVVNANPSYAVDALGTYTLMGIAGDIMAHRQHQLA